MKQIAEALGSTTHSVRNCMYKISVETGYIIPYLQISQVQKSDAAVEQPKLPPSYRPKKDTVPRKCSTCVNTDCAGRCRAVCWTGCGMWMPLEDNQEAVP